MSVNPAPLKSKVSNRCFVEYEISLSGTEIKLYTHALFKRVVKIGTKFVVVVELFGNVVPEYSVEVVQVFSMNYIPVSAKYIDSVVLADGKIAHFYVQPKGASTDVSTATQLLAHEIRRPASPPREEDSIAFADREGF